MSSSISTTPGGSSRRSFFLFLLLVPVGIFVILAALLVVEFKQFRAMVSPTTADVPEFAWSDSAHARVDSVEADLHAFVDRDTSRVKSDSLWISGGDLTLLLGSSNIALSHGIRVHVTTTDSLIIVQSTQPVQALQGQLAWVFKKIAPSGYLNARIEGYPILKDGKLTFFPVRGFLNGHKIPTTTWTKQGGFSAASFIGHQDFYNAFLRAVGDIQVTPKGMLLLRNP